MCRPACQACGGPLKRPVGTYRRCVRCKSLELEGQHELSDEQVLATYSDPGYHASGEDRGRLYYQSRLALLRSVTVAARPRVLEIGAGTGLFAHAASQDGFDVEAIEPGSRFNEARLLLGERARCLTWEEALSSDNLGRWDAIVAWEVIEHLLEPHAFVRAASLALRRSGTLIVSTPNARSWSVRLLGSSDPMLCPTEHLRLFSARGLEAVMSVPAASQMSVRGFGWLLPTEVQSGIERATKLRAPSPVARILSAATRAVRHTSLSLGLEGILRVR